MRRAHGPAEGTAAAGRCKPLRAVALRRDEHLEEALAAEVVGGAAHLRPQTLCHRVRELAAYVVAEPLPPAQVAPHGVQLLWCDGAHVERRRFGGRGRGERPADTDAALTPFADDERPCRDVA